MKNYNLKLTQNGTNVVLAQSTLTEEELTKQLNQSFAKLRGWINNITSIGIRKEKRYTFSINSTSVEFEGGKFGKSLNKVFLVALIASDPNKGFFANDLNEQTKAIVKSLSLTEGNIRLLQNCDAILEGSKSINALKAQKVDLIGTNATMQLIEEKAPQRRPRKVTRKPKATDAKATDAKATDAKATDAKATDAKA